MHAGVPFLQNLHSDIQHKGFHDFGITSRVRVERAPSTKPSSANAFYGICLPPFECGWRVVSWQAVYQRCAVRAQPCAVINVPCLRVGQIQIVARPLGLAAWMCAA